MKSALPRPGNGCLYFEKFFIQILKLLDVPGLIGELPQKGIATYANAQSMPTGPSLSAGVVPNPQIERVNDKVRRLFVVNPVFNFDFFLVKGYAFDIVLLCQILNEEGD